MTPNLSPPRISRFTLCALVAGVIALFSPSASSEEAELDPAAWPLSSIGRVNVITGAGRRSQCTGTLIGSQHVLTAAHCLFDKSRGRWAHPTSIHFVAGYDHGEYRAHSQAASYERGEGFVFTEPPEPRAAAQDWAIITLVTEVDLKPIRVALENEGTGDRSSIVRAGYRGDRPHVLTIQRDCSAKIVSEPAALLLHSCRSTHGESGSALLLVTEGQPRIIGVLVARSREETGAPSFAVPARTFAGAVREALEAK